MSKSKEIWDTLNTIDVNKHTNKKGRFTYLSWTWAWATLQEEFPDSSYEFKDLLWMPNNTCEVWVELTIEGITRSMWLAVTDHNNKPVINPSCDLVANARMRCLVKAIAMFGLGHYIYAGESLPMQPEQPAQVFELDADIVAQFESVKTIEELQELWAGVDNKTAYNKAKNTAKERLS